jgi:transglutaminase-like putative cysteine protease
LWTVLTTIAVLIGPTDGFGESARDYDNWQVASAGGTPFSSIHTRRTRAADGNEYLTQESRVLIDVLGQRQEISESSECRSTAGLFPLSYRYQQRSLSGASTGEGRAEGNEFVLVLRRGEMTLERRASLLDKPVFAEQVTDFLATKSDVSGPFALAVLQGSSCTVKRAKATRHPEADGRTRWTLEYEDGVGSATVTLKADGTMKRVESTCPHRVIELSSAEAAGNIRHLTFSKRELLTYPMTEPLPFPERAQAITMKLSWRNTPLEQLSLEDARQKLTKHEVDGDRHVAQVRLAQPAAVTQPAKLPITNPDLAPFLAEETFICPRHPAIRQKAAEWTAGATDALDAVTKLTHHVSEYLSTGEMIAETLSGPEVLECRKGKCAEFTTLLASLGRAAGIPTRVALGMRLVAGSWVGHMWCEMWVGQWIPVDATADEVGGSPALLRLTHSDTVEGTQRARWAMSESLDVAFVSVEKAAAAASGLTTGIVGQTYTNADHRFRLTVPDAGWTIVDKSAGGLVLLELKPPGTLPAVNVVAAGLPMKLGVEVMLAQRKSIYAQRKGFKILRDETLSVGQQSGRLFEFCLDAPDPAGGKVKMVTEVLWIDDKSFYLMNFGADETTHPKFLEQFRKVLGSFEQME